MNEINNGLGNDYFIEVAQPTNTGWNFDYTNVYWKIKRNIEKEITFDDLGNPKNCTFKIYGLFIHENDFKNRLRTQIISTLFLYSNYDLNLLTIVGSDSVYFDIQEYSEDFLNILLVKNSLEKAVDLSLYTNEINKSPIANAGSDIINKNVDEFITLNASSSFDPDGSIISYKWHQMFGEKESTEYMTSNKVELSDTISSIVSFIPHLPGNYVFKLRVIDNNGSSSEDLINVEVFFQDDTNPIEIKGVSLGPYYDPNFDKFDDYFDHLKSLHVKSICICPDWWMPDIHSTEIHPLDSLSRDLPKGLTWGDGRLKKFIALAHQNDFTVFLKPGVNIYYWAGGAPDVEPSNWNEWFESFKNFINHYANIAEQTNVELFSVGVELSKTEGQTDKWKEVINSVRNIYNGSITYSAATTYIDNFLDLIKF